MNMGIYCIYNLFIVLYTMTCIMKFSLLFLLLQSGQDHTFF